MNLQRYKQISEFPTLDKNNIKDKDGLKSNKNRSDFRYNLKENNEEILKNKIGKDIFKEYIISKITDEELTLQEIDDLRFKILKTEGIIIPTGLSIYKVLYNLFLENILLPDYVEGWEKEDVFKELNKILERVQGRTQKILEKLNQNGFFNISLGLTDEIENEIAGFNGVGGFIEHRTFDIGGIFGSINIGESSEARGPYNFEIPVRIPNGKKQKEGEKEEFEKNIEVEKIEEILDKYFQKGKGGERDILSGKKIFKGMKDFYLTVEKKINKDGKFGDDFGNYYVIGIKNHKIKFLSDEENSPEEITNYLEQYFKIANLLVNEIGKKSGVEHNTRFFNFSTMYFYDTGIDEENDIGKDTLEKFSKMLVEMKEPIKLDDVGGQEKAKNEIKKIIKSIKYEAVMKSWGSKTTSGIIFEGPPGTGKTLLARCIASEVDGLFYNIKLTDIASSAYINEGANNLKELFKFLRHKAKKTDKKIIVNLDELEALFKKREGKNQSGEDTKIVNTFLSEMGGFDDFPNIIFIGTTNLKENLDPAVVRSGRLSTSVTVDLPNEEARKQIFQIHLNKAKKTSKKVEGIINGIDFDEISQKSEGLSGADIEEIVRILIEEKAIEEIENGKASLIKTENFLNKIEEFVKRSENSKKIFGKINQENILEKLSDKENGAIYRNALMQILGNKIANELEEGVLKGKIKSSEIEEILVKNIGGGSKMGFM